MRRMSAWTIVAGALLSCAACGTAGPAPTLSPAEASARAARAPRPPVNDADVTFMSGMIHHHAQAVLMAGWAGSHEAGEALRRFCERIVVGQQDEIAVMSNWLLDREQPVPDVDPAHMGMAGMDHGTMMPGMLSAEQLAQLDAARGAEFDRLFLLFMIQHHEGAIIMVDDLFGSFGGGQDETVFRLASDIYADQTTEIERMHSMLDAMP